MSKDELQRSLNALDSLSQTSSLLGSAGKAAASTPMKIPVDTGEIAPNMPEMADPMTLLAARANQERASLIGSLAGAYLTMTNLQPGDVELVQRSTEDGSIAFRFRPKVPQDELLVIMVDERASENNTDEPYCIMPSGTSEEAAALFAEQVQQHLESEHGIEEPCVWVRSVKYSGFGEDLDR